MTLLFFLASLVSIALIAVTSVQSPSRVQLFGSPWTAAHQASLSITISWSLPKFMSIALVMPSSHLILWCPLLLLPSKFSSITDFSNELAIHIWWPKYWGFSISPSKEYSGLISLQIDWFDLLAVQGTFRSLLQHHSLKASILWCSARFMVQFSQLYKTTGNHSLDYMNLCWQSNASAFYHTVSVYHSFSAKKYSYLYNFTTYFCLFSLLLHWNIYCLNSLMFIFFTYYCRTITYRIMPGSTDTPLIHLMNKWMNDTNYGKLWGTQM